MELQIRGCGYIFPGVGYTLPDCPRGTYTDWSSQSIRRPPSWRHTRAWSTNQGAVAQELSGAGNGWFHHFFTWASMRARRSSSSFFFLMFSFSCLASDTAWRNWSKMPKNSSGWILPASSPKCFTALVNWKQGGFKKFSVPREFCDQIEIPLEGVKLKESQM